MPEAITDPASTESARDLRKLVDRNAITDLVSRLGLWLDEKRFDEALSILTEDATAETPGGIARGRDALVEQARRNHGEGTGTQHLIANTVIDLDGDRATIGANLVATFFDPSQVAEPRFQLGERYRFEAVRTPEGWRISAVKTTPMWFEGVRPNT